MLLIKLFQFKTRKLPSKIFIVNVVVSMLCLQSDTPDLSKVIDRHLLGKGGGLVNGATAGRRGAAEVGDKAQKGSSEV